MKISELQREHFEWQKRNFPNTMPHSPLLLLTEEVGELAHAHLRREQGICGSAEKHHVLAKDAVGDILVSLAAYCNANGYDLEKCVDEVWAEVKTRDYTSGELKNG